MVWGLDEVLRKLEQTKQYSFDPKNKIVLTKEQVGEIVAHVSDLGHSQALAFHPAGERGEFVSDTLKYFTNPKLAGPG